ncbi:MAG: hypothetical protein NC412_13775 [Roseburia sp.]|nr:hypothetical protein [Roseburia sp.]MCM1280064.1 hypothetical protein [Robinsoniella sp.]
MSRREQREREKRKRLLELYALELREELNIRLLCETEGESLVQKQVLWIEDIALTEVTYPQNKKTFVLGKILALWIQKIKIWLHNNRFL